jgi:hypothetical protein
LFNNKIVQWLIAAIIIFGICWVARINLSGSVGSNGIHGSIDRGQ